MVRKLGGSTKPACRTSLECWVPCTCTTDWKIPKERIFTCTSYSSYKRYQRMMLAISEKIIHGFSTIQNSSGARQPFVWHYSQDRKGAWSRLYYYFPLACYSNHLPCLSQKYCLYPVEEGKLFQKLYTPIYMAPYCSRLQSAKDWAFICRHTAHDPVVDLYETFLNMAICNDKNYYF